jgi:hypothetical protein
LRHTYFRDVRFVADGDFTTRQTAAKKYFTTKNYDDWNRPVTITVKCHTYRRQNVRCISLRYQ